MNVISISIIFLSYHLCISAKSQETHLLPEVKIVGYEGPMSKEMLALFKAVEVIEFINSTFTSAPERVFAHLPKLKIVYFENMTTTNINSDVAQDGLSLEEFSFIRCGWNDPHVEYWNGYVNLKKLVISENKYPFVELKANSLDRTSLKHLELTKIGIEKIDDQAFNNLDKLKTLILADNKIKTISKATLAPLKNLKKLDLQGNLLESFETSQIPDLPKLESVNLSHNPLKSLNLEGIEKLAPKLKNIDLSYTEIPEGIFEDLSKKYNIKVLKKCHLSLELS